MDWRWLAFALVLVAGWLLTGRAGGGDGVDDALRARLGGERVVMFTAEWCGYCRSLKQDLDGAGVAYREIDVESAPGDDLFADIDGRGVPVTVVDREVVRGYDPTRVLALARPAP